MRALLFAFAATSLALAGCGKKQAETNSSAFDESVSSQGSATNDTTSIDAATGDAANMAADADVNQPDNDSANRSAASDHPSPRSRPAAPSAKTSSDATIETLPSANPPANATAG